MPTKMKILIAVIVVLFATIIFVYIAGGFAMTSVKLPQPQTNSTFPLDQALKERRSVRDFQIKELTGEQISTLLWAADGISDVKNGFRTAPSPGALYPIDLYLVKSDGLWLYNPAHNALKLVKTGDLRIELSKAALNQTVVATAPVDVVLVADLDRIKPKYSERSLQFCYLEAGHIAQNLALEAVALNLASVPVGGFVEVQANKLLALSSSQTVLYILPVGVKK